jgi:spermidine synthase
MKDAGELFNIVDYAKTSIPTYPSGTIGFIMCSVAEPGKQLKVPAQQPDEDMR